MESLSRHSALHDHDCLFGDCPIAVCEVADDFIQRRGNVVQCYKRKKKPCIYTLLVHTAGHEVSLAAMALQYSIQCFFEISQSNCLRVPQLSVLTASKAIGIGAANPWKAWQWCCEVLQLAMA